MKDRPGFYKPTKAEWDKEAATFDVYLLCRRKGYLPHSLGAN